MTRNSIRAWYLVHKWTSIVSTAFLLMLCITGLPLIFHEEIDVLTEGEPIYGMPGVASSSETPGLHSLDSVLASAMAKRPGEVPLFFSFDDENPMVVITTGPTPDAKPEQMTSQLFDRSTGKPLGELTDEGVMHFLLQLHVDMFMGLPGMFFLGAMGLLFTAAIVSGVVLYAPFMRKLAFGTLRTTRSTRLKWLDYHNLLGVVTLAWASVVGLTGVINTLATPIIMLWQNGAVAEMTADYADKPPLAPVRYVSLDRAMGEAREALPGNAPVFVAFPGGGFSSKHHYSVFFQGDTPLTERLLTPALIDAETGTFTDSRPLPWYAQALLLSQPLHFGDYGGLPLKILWAVLDVLTIIVLGSGLYLWLGKRHAGVEAHVREVETGAAVEAA